MKHITVILRNFILYMLLLLLFGFLFHCLFHRPFHLFSFFTDPAILAAIITYLVVSALLEFSLPLLRRWWRDR